MVAQNNNHMETYEWDAALDTIELGGWSPGISLGFQCYGDNREVFQLTTDRLRHTYVLGGTGSGKSTSLAWMALQDIKAKTPIVMFDSGDLIRRLVRQLDKEYLDDLIVVDFSDLDNHVRFNLFDVDIDNKTAVDRASEEIIYLLTGDVPPSYAGPRYEQKMRTAIYTVFDRGFPYERSVLCAIRLIMDKQYRIDVLRTIEDPKVIRSWKMEELASKSNDYGDYQQWVYCKSDIFENNLALRLFYGAGNTTLDIVKEMVGSKSMLFIIDESVLGPKVTAILRRHLTRMTKEGVMLRSSLGEEQLTPRFLYFDEFQQYVTCDSVPELFNWSRKYKIGISAANQNLRQLNQYNRQTETMSTEVLESVLANAGTLITFRPSASDAERLAPEFDLKPEELRRVPRYSATVRLLSDGQPLKPVVVKVPMDRGPFFKDNREILLKLMVEKGILVSRKDSSSDHTGKLHDDCSGKTDEPDSVIGDNQGI